MNPNDRELIIEVFRSVSRKILCSSLGESAGEAVLFFLRKRLGRDPFEVFWEDPRAVYCELERIFGVGANILINLLINGIRQECGLDMSPERFSDLMRSRDQRSVEEIRSFLRRVAESYEYKGGEVR